MDTKIKNSLALLVLVIFALLAEQAILQSQRVNELTYDLLTRQIIQPKTPINGQAILVADYSGAKVALPGVIIPLYPGAKRLTFDGGNTITYRSTVPANEVADFYTQSLASQGWRPLNNIPTQNINSVDLEKITIVLSENSITKKTDVTYAYLPTEIKVLGIQLAQDTSISSSPAEEPSQPQQQNIPAGTDNQPAPQPLMQPQQNQINMPNQGQQNQTCRVNGVDMPGSCQTYNNNGGNASSEWARPGTYGQMMQPQNQPGQQGPSEEEIKKMDEQRFQNMKKGLAQFTKSIKSMKKSVARVKTAIAKCGVNIPEELTNALANSDAATAKIQAAQNADELDEIITDIEDIGAVMQDWGPRLGDLQRLCQMIKQADKDMKQLDRSVKQVEAKAKANKKIDLSEIITEFKNNVNGLRATLAQVKELAKTDAEESLAKLEDDFYGQMDNVRNSEQAIQMALNVSKGVSDITREIKNYEKQIKALKNKKVDVAEAEALLAVLKNQIAEIKNFAKGKFAAEELVDKVDEAFNTRADLQDALQALGAGPQLMPQIKNTQVYNNQINLPDAFKKQPLNTEGENNSEPGNIDTNFNIGPNQPTMPAAGN